MIHVFMVDDHSLARVALRLMMERDGDVKVIGEACDADSAVRMIPFSAPDVVVCDFDLGDSDGLTVTRSLLGIDPGFRVLIVSMRDRGPVSRMVLAAGALGFVSKSSPPGRLLDAVREVARGRRYLDEALPGSTLLTPSPLDRLSARELMVLHMRLQGADNHRAAQLLGIAESTVRTMRARAMAKLGVRTHTGLVRLALEHGFI
jgi:two-component system invasion response regulator UvrY